MVALAFGSNPQKGGSGSKSGDDDEKRSEKKKDRARVSVGAVDLFKDYNANEIAADEKYKGKTLIVSGKIRSIDKSIGDAMYLSIATSNQFQSIQAHLVESQKSKAATLKKGEDVTVECVGDGMLIGSPMLRECSIQ